MIEAAADIAGDDPTYTALVERLSSFVAERTSEAEGALVLLRRAQKLSFDEHFEMIRLLGRAAMGLTKKEHTEKLIEAVLSLAHAYRSAGLLWAARSACFFGVASVLIQAEEDGDVPITIIPALKLLAGITLELRHIPDFLAAIQLFNGAARSLPLTDESKELVSEDRGDHRWLGRGCLRDRAGAEGCAAYRACDDRDRHRQLHLGTRFLNVRTGHEGRGTLASGLEAERVRTSGRYSEIPVRGCRRDTRL
jgi:hypothetical protein